MLVIHSLELHVHLGEWVLDGLCIVGAYGPIGIELGCCIGELYHT